MPDVLRRVKTNLFSAGQTYIRFIYVNTECIPAQINPICAIHPTNITLTAIRQPYFINPFLDFIQTSRSRDLIVVWSLSRQRATFWPPENWNLSKWPKVETFLKTHLSKEPHGECFQKISWNLNGNYEIWPREVWRRDARADEQTDMGCLQSSSTQLKSYFYVFIGLV